jgi:hypothetical protein
MKRRGAKYEMELKQQRDLRDESWSISKRMDLRITTLAMSTLPHTGQPELGPVLVDLLQWEQHIEPDKD